MTIVAAACSFSVIEIAQFGPLILEEDAWGNNLSKLRLNQRRLAEAILARLAEF